MALRNNISGKKDVLSTAKNSEKLAQEKVRRVVALLIIDYEVNAQKLFQNIELILHQFMVIPKSDSSINL